MWINTRDHIGEPVVLPARPMRIVSLVPSQTELLYDLGLGERVVGITKFCVHPQAWFRTKPRVGGTKKVDIEKVRALGADLVIANKEENLREDVEAIRAFCPVWTSDICDLPSALRMIRDVGELVGEPDAAAALVEEISGGMARLAPMPPLVQGAGGITARMRVLYLIWREPYMSVGRDTFIHDMLQRIGLENVMGGTMRYPVVELTELRGKVDLVYLSSEPYPFKQKHIEEISAILPEAKVMLVDGEMFSWYGSRLRRFFDYVQGPYLAGQQSDK